MDPSSNCWVDISAYFRENNRELVEALLSWTTNYAIKIDEKAVIQTAYLCSVIQAISSKDKYVILEVRDARTDGHTHGRILALYNATKFNITKCC
jgi:hypothetical protein